MNAVRQDEQIEALPAAPTPAAVERVSAVEVLSAIVLFLLLSMENIL